MSQINFHLSYVVTLWLTIFFNGQFFNFFFEQCNWERCLGLEHPLPVPIYPTVEDAFCMHRIWATTFVSEHKSILSRRKCLHILSSTGNETILFNIARFIAIHWCSPFWFFPIGLEVFLPFGKEVILPIYGGIFAYWCEGIFTYWCEGIFTYWCKCNLPTGVEVFLPICVNVIYLLVWRYFYQLEWGFLPIGVNVFYLLECGFFT